MNPGTRWVVVTGDLGLWMNNSLVFSQVGFAAD